jgi:hypothetical protein
MYTLEDVFEQAENDNYSTSLPLQNGKSYIRPSVIIKKFPNHIDILNVGKGGAYYKAITGSELEYFLEHGWIKGSVKVSLNNCTHKLRLVELGIKKEVNTRKNDKYIKGLKNKRDNILKKYAVLKIKLNKII